MLEINVFTLVYLISVTFSNILKHYSDVLEHPGHLLKSPYYSMMYRKYTLPNFYRQYFLWYLGVFLGIVSQNWNAYVKCSFLSRWNI